MVTNEELLVEMEKRHSVRSYKDMPLEEDVIKELNFEIKEINKESGLHIQLIVNEPKAFSGFLGKIGSFSNAVNYLALIGRDDDELDEKCGFYGEKLVLIAQKLGLNTCWVAGTYKNIHEAYMLNEGEKLLLVISLGYGVNAGVPHKNKTIEEISDVNETSPLWYKNGISAVVLAPSAMNRQNFTFKLVGDEVLAKEIPSKWGKVDLGIAKFHFVIGSNKDSNIFIK